MTALELRYLELRADALDGRVLTGPAVVYGDEARIGGRFRERVEAGAYEINPNATLTIQHLREAVVARTGAGLTLTDSPAGVAMVADLPVSPRADQLLADVRNGLMRGLSVEQHVLRDRYDGSLRVIEKAILVRLSVVDIGAYPQSVVEAREALLEAQEPPKRRRRVVLWL